MQQVPADTSAAFQRRLDQAQVPADQRQDYQKWVCFYLDSCTKYGHSPALPTSLGPFLTKLAAKNQSVGQRNQAAAAVRLLLQAGPEPSPTPAPRPATPAGRPPATLGRTSRARSSPPAAPSAESGPAATATAGRATANSRAGPGHTPGTADRPGCPIGWRPEHSPGRGPHAGTRLWARRLMGAGVPRPGGGDPAPELRAQDVVGLPAMGGQVRVFDPQQRFGAIAAPRTVGHGSASLPMGCAETLVMRLPDDYHQAARDTLAHRPRSACGPRRIFAGDSP
jgi:hypothetical protein